MNKELLDKYVADGWLVTQKHPTLPLSIYNYSQKTQYDGHWDEVTLACRGLIVDSSTGKVIVRPFPKFFNYEEVEAEVLPFRLPHPRRCDDTGQSLTAREQLPQGAHDEKLVIGRHVVQTLTQPDDALPDPR